MSKTNRFSIAISRQLTDNKGAVRPEELRFGLDDQVAIAHPALAARSEVVRHFLAPRANQGPRGRLDGEVAIPAGRFPDRRVAERR
jgi:hypothetical protein